MFAGLGTDFCRRGRLEEWVHAYLLSHGNNRAFSEGLRRCPRCFMEPFRLPRGWFTRCCGLEPGMKYPVEALTRLGAAECSVIVWCTGEEDRRAFLAVYARYKAQQR